MSKVDGKISVGPHLPDMAKYLLGQQQSVEEENDEKRIRRIGQKG
jgi:hypothetical protein